MYVNNALNNNQRGMFKQGKTTIFFFFVLKPENIFPRDSLTSKVLGRTDNMKSQIETFDEKFLMRQSDSPSYQ